MRPLRSCLSMLLPSLLLIAAALPAAAEEQSDSFTLRLGIETAGEPAWVTFARNGESTEVSVKLPADAPDTVRPRLIAELREGRCAADAGEVLATLEFRDNQQRSSSLESTPVVFTARDRLDVEFDRLREQELSFRIIRQAPEGDNPLSCGNLADAGEAENQ